MNTSSVIIVKFKEMIGLALLDEFIQVSEIVCKWNQSSLEALNIPYPELKLLLDVLHIGFFETDLDSCRFRESIDFH